MISRRDVEKAERDGRAHLTVASCMAHTVCSTTEDTLLEDALAEMERADVGRLPVMRGDRLVGIVSRTDLLAFLYGEEARSVATARTSPEDAL
jgi:tRNA nucleotidyltransferase (CCA-adding enzyme)